MRLELGNAVRCADGGGGRVRDAVLDRRSGTVTHLVVQPAGESEAPRLVPMALADREPAAGGEVTLRCTVAALKEMEPVREYAYVRPGEQLDVDPEWDVGVEDMYTTPHYAPADFGQFVGDLDSGVGVAYDRVPKGEIELRHASAVYSADRHHLGSVEGLLVDADDRVTHLLLERGHLWWRREISVPLEAVAKLETDLVTLGVPKRELRRFRSTSR